MNKTEIIRLYKLHNIKNDIAFKDNYTTAYFRITRVKHDEADFPEPIAFSANYATVYCEKNEPKFFTCSSTLISSDGEYHPFLCNYPRSMLANRHAPKIGQQFEEYLMPDFKEGKAKWEVNCFPPNPELEKRFHESDEWMILYIMAWAQHCREILSGEAPLHQVENFTQSITRTKNDHKVFDEISNKDPVETGRITSSAVYFIKGFKFYEYLIMGMKTVPMTMRDSEYKNDIGQSLWKEVRMNYLASQLAINQVSPSFPMTLAHFVVRDANALMFDNKSMQKKIERSIFASSLLKSLEDTRERILKDDPTPTDNFGRLSDLIEGSEEFIREELYVVPRTMCVVSEYMGKTWNDIPQLYQREWFITDAGDLRTYETASKYIFEFLYALYCLHTKLYMIHGDLHLNNITISYRHSGIARQKCFLTYIFEGTPYVFITKIMHAAIIDFSRSLLFEDVITENLTADVEDYIEKQRKNIFKIYRSEFKEFYQNNSVKLNSLLTHNTKRFYKMFSAIDLYRLFTGLEHIFTKIGAEKKVLRLIDEIKKISIYYLTNLSLRLSDNQEFEYPAALAIKKLFGEHLADNVPKSFWDATPLEIYNSSNKLKYDLLSQENYPPIVAEGLPKEKATKMEISDKVRIRRQPFLSL
ncbi:hypothetical protein BNJ_00127 [Kaumoebavirus]|uniref:hypothetical protein n=1 Tax=Kaumoebavirus TaxID=1859492 RepID=UPI0009C30F3B|nr:hypothetical protein BNJ_00127 [Kaumoebavirus]ARA71960.1 hypothetical protein BNJ_00127 [Kaumoebavirus]